MARAKQRVLQFAAILADVAGLGALADALRALALGELMALAAHVRANICLQALNQYRLGKLRGRRRHPHPLAPTMRYRRRGASAYRRIAHPAFKGMGLASRTPERLIAAITRAIDAAPRLIAAILRRLRRGFKGQQPTLGRVIATTLPAAPTPRAAILADTS